MDHDHQRESILDILRRKDMSRIKVLLYDDRVKHDRSLVFFSPLLTPFGYFRTLNGWQLLSWTGWLFMLTWLWRRYSGKVRIPVLLAGAGSLYTAVLGGTLLGRSGPLESYNEIYAEYGTILAGIGTGILLYTAILIVTETRKI
jgi:hypothetical protein